MNTLDDFVETFGTSKWEKYSFQLLRINRKGKLIEKEKFETLEEVNLCAMLFPQFKILIFHSDLGGSLGFILRGYKWMYESSIKIQQKNRFLIPENKRRNIYDKN